MSEVKLCRRKSRIGQIIPVGIVFLWIAVLVFFPLAGIIRFTFEHGVAPFWHSLATPEARNAFWLTIWITTISVVLNVFFGVILALVLARQRFLGKSLWEEFINLPLAVSPVVAGFMFILLFGRNGWFGHWFEAGGIQIIYAIPGMVMATIFVTLPFVTKQVIPVLNECGTDMEEAARTLGAGPWQIFRHITLPSIRWGLVYGITLTTARALGEFGAVLVVSGSIIGRTQTATLHIHQEFTDFHYQGAFSASFVLASVSFCMLLFLELIKRRKYFA